MKNQVKFTIAIAVIAAVFYSCAAKAQTNSMPSFSSGLQQIYDSATSATNYGIAFGGGRSTTGQRNLAFGELLYNFTPSVGLIIGYDYLWASKHFKSTIAGKSSQGRY